MERLLCCVLLYSSTSAATLQAKSERHAQDLLHPPNASQQHHPLLQVPMLSTTIKPMEELYIRVYLQESFSKNRRTDTMLFTSSLSHERTTPSPQVPENPGPCNKQEARDRMSDLSSSLSSQLGLAACGAQLSQKSGRRAAQFRI